MRWASGEFLARFIPDIYPATRAAGERAARNGNDSPNGHITHRLQGLSLRIKYLIPSSRLRDDNFCAPPNQITNGTTGKRRDLLSIRIVYMIPAASIIDIGYLPLLSYSDIGK